MNIEDEVKLLRKIGMFASLDASRLKLLAFTSEWLTYDSGQMLFEQGEMGDAAYIIVEGEVGVFVSSDGGLMQVASRGESEIIGEIAILCGVPRTATVKALNETHVLKISKDVFGKLITDNPDTALEIIRALAERLETTTAALREAKAANA